MFDACGEPLSIAKLEKTLNVLILKFLLSCLGILRVVVFICRISPVNNNGLDLNPKSVLKIDLIKNNFNIKDTLHHKQGDQIGRNFTIWATF